MKSLLSRIRYILVVGLCSLVLFSSFVSSAAAQAVVKDKPMVNEASEVAKKYEQTAKDSIDKGGLKSLEEVRDRSAGGAPNEIQGTTGIEDMKRPSNTSATSIEQQIKTGLDNAGEAPEKLTKEAKKAARETEKQAKKAAKNAEKQAKKATKEAKKAAAGMAN